jgi:hypothetical protein
MPTDPVPTGTARPNAPRDEALCRYTQHLAAVQLKNSRWCAMLSRGGLAARHRAVSLFAVPVKPISHAH